MSGCISWEGRSEHYKRDAKETKEVSVLSVSVGLVS